MYISLKCRPSFVPVTAVLLFAPSQGTSPFPKAHGCRDAQRRPLNGVLSSYRRH
ncbi:hypothetical protein HYPSUDRAFT_49957 [Hypholoma sublateritium FD-334 SS-4]|uniref:Uncharacterized protein n=1 Tax=Hypholoma sublateritium (strain FD-334 SS-4) TaxID=945553 RepID=A0A0D2KFS5_HYPSF|nr:hypothetical protein HYPSUDRAFT_49957 [Hypholoma sublateritium FD-334 SS-4]